MKNISIILILSLLYSSIGCHTTTATLKSEHNLSKHLDEGRKLNIVTKDSVVYFFNAGTYKIEDDTLIGNGQQVIQNQRQDPGPIKLNVEDISQIQYYTNDESGSGFGVLVIISVVGLIIVGILSGLSNWTL